MSTANLVLFSYASKTYCTFHILKKLTSDRFIEQTLIKNHYIAVINIRKTQNHNCLPKLKTSYGSTRWLVWSPNEPDCPWLNVTIYTRYTQKSILLHEAVESVGIYRVIRYKRGQYNCAYPLIIVSLLQGFLEPWQQVHRIKRLILALDGNLKRMWVREGVIC